MSVSKTHKIVSVLFESVPLVAGASSIYSCVFPYPSTMAIPIYLGDSWGACLHMKLTNGATGPTVPAQIQVEVSPNKIAWFKFGGIWMGSTANSGIKSWGGIIIPMGTGYLRLVAGSNTDQNVTIDADISRVVSASG
jgi:hypothetical protein